MMKIYKLTLSISLLCCLLQLESIAQSNSPYAGYGIGSLLPAAGLQVAGMAGLSGAMRDPFLINPASPASYSALALTVFDAGAHASFTKLSNGKQSQGSAGVSFSYFSMGFPLWQQKAGLAFGIHRYSDVGYAASTVNTSNNQITALRTRFGEGGYAKAFVGLGYAISKRLSVGANLGYLFGTIHHNQTISFPNDPNALESMRSHVLAAAGLVFDVGMQYMQPLAKNKFLVFAYNTSLPASIATQERVTNKVQTTAVTDPIAQRGRFNVPIKHSLGFFYEKQSQLQLGFDLSYQDWRLLKSEVQSSNFDQFYGLFEATDAYILTLGGQYTPNVQAISSYLKRMDYRFGFSYGKLYTQVNNQDIPALLLAFGFGFPLSKAFASGLLYNITKMNVAVQLGQKGSTRNQLLQEQFINLRLGFVLGTRWFVRRKLD